MFELDGSETSWLIYCDWLEDHDKDNSLVKFGLDELTINQWCYEYAFIGIYYGTAGTYGISINKTGSVGGRLVGGVVDAGDVGVMGHHRVGSSDPVGRYVGSQCL